MKKLNHLEKSDFRKGITDPSRICPPRPAGVPEPRIANITLLNNFRLEQIKNLIANIDFVMEQEEVIEKN